jgi:tetratricopeptide (TPR) repeat protein
MSRDVDLLRKRLSGLAARRSGFAVGLRGPAGIGKTFAALEILRTASCRTVGIRAIAPVTGLLQALPRPKRLSIWIERELEQPEPSPEAITALLAALAPVVVHIEDLHETTPTQLEFWQALARAVLRSRGVALMATSRIELPEPFETLMLEALSSEASVELLEREAGSGLPREATVWIEAKAAGNPLFTLEFFRSLARRGFVWSDGSHWHWRVPDRDVLPTTVEAMIERSITEACHDAATRTALEARAYLESLEPNLKPEPSVWAHVAGLEPEVLAKAEQNFRVRGVLNELGFVHPLFREVPVKGLNVRDRKAFANRTLEVLPLETAAVFIADAQLGPERSLELLRQAAEASNTPGRWLALAVEFSSGTDRTRLALEAARELTSTDLHQAQKLYRLALEGSTVEGSTVEGSTVEGSTDPAVTLEFIAFLAPRQPKEAKTLFEALPESIRISTQGLVARFQMMVVSSDVNGIIDCWRNEFGSSSDLSPDALVHVIQSLKSLDRCDDAIQLADQVLARVDLSPWQRARVMNRKYGAYSQSNRYVQALELSNRVLEWLATHGLPGRDMILSDRAMYRTNLGDYRAARTDYEEALQLARAVGRTQTEMEIHYALGELHCEFGEYALAEEFLLEAFEYLVQRPIGDYLCDTVNALIELYLAWRERPSSGLLAQKYARLSLEYAEATGFPAYLAASRTFAGFVELEYNSPTRALELALEAKGFRAVEHQFFGRWFPTWLEAKARSKLGDQAQARVLLEQAITGFEQIGRAIYVNLAGLDLDRLRDDVSSARSRLEWFRERGMIKSVHFCLRLFPELASDVTEANLEPRAIAQLQVLGSVQLLITGKPELVRGGKRKELLALLLESRIMGRSEVSRLNLFDVLYPDAEEAQASAALSNLVYHLREQFGPNTVLSSDGGYTLGGITSDAEAFLETGDTRFWRSGYLEGNDLAGGETVRETLHLALRNRAESLLETDPTEAVRVGRLLCTADPYDLESLRLTLRALRASDNHKNLKSTYARARTILLEIGEVLPERWMDFLERPTGKSA